MTCAPTTVHDPIVGDRAAKDALYDAFAEVAKALGSGRRAEIVDRAELAIRLRRGDVVVLDVRPPAEFAAGHITGARSVPPGELRRQLRAIPKDVDVVAYCRGPYCVFADDAVRLLLAKGYRARRLTDGYPEWKRAGLPVAVGE